MSDMPDVIYVDNDIDKQRSLSPVYIHLLPLTTKYIRVDIADQLAEALEYVAADMNDSMPIPSDVISRVTQALATYRKAKGE